MSAEAELGEHPSEDVEELAAIRALFYSVFEQLTLSDSIELSNQGTAELDLMRTGFTYGETGLQATLQVLRAVDLPSFCCKCKHCEPRSTEHRCHVCGLRPSGASIVDLGSGIGNVVVGIALLVGGAIARASSVSGVELLRPLHRTGSHLFETLQEKLGAASAMGQPLVPEPLPAVGFHCKDLLWFGLWDTDVCYLCSTAFSPELLEKWTAQAFNQLRVGSRGP